MHHLKTILQFFWITHLKKTLLFLTTLTLVYWFCLPQKIFDTPTSIVLVDRNGFLLGARIALDGQWRFPHNDSVPEKFALAITEYEDRRFYNHIGIDIKGIGRAARDNYNEGKISSGASTISMQVIRMSKQRKGRSFYRKIEEMVMATRLELRYTKEEILALYASNAPFGGNVVGLDAAAWRYYGKSPDLLSWGEAATLAVLPNSPGLVHPGRNRNTLLEKRNRLLSKLAERGLLDSTTVLLAKMEAIPEDPLPLPQLAPHLVNRIDQEQTGNQEQKKHAYYKTTLDADMQLRVQQIMIQQHQQLSANGIHNMAVLVTNTKTGEVLSYWGNILSEANKEHGQNVDVLVAPRSTGSILKPFLYASMLHNGSILPNSLVPDVPMYLGGYRPQNFYENYDGLVPASRALVRSLNIPMVRMLQEYGIANFSIQLQKMGLTTITKTPKHYGLSLILGGAEATLWDLCGSYASMGRTLINYNQRSKNIGQYAYSDHDFCPLHVLKKDSILTPTLFLKEAPVLSAASIYNTFEVMRELERPISEGGWKYFESTKDIAWKTGTSFGFRDAWAIGVTPEFTVGVWVGNADGEGRQGLIGVHAAAPIVFEIFNQLPTTTWFEAPKKELTKVAVCKISGYRLGAFCEEVDSVEVGFQGKKVDICSFHQQLHLDSSGTYQVHGNCESVNKMRHQNWFILPPLEAYYYQQKNPAYKKPPIFREDCRLNEAQNTMQFIYPKNATKIFIPVDFDGQLNATVFKIAHQNSKKTVYWHLDNQYLGMTKDFHEMELKPVAGMHKVVLVDEDGVRIEQEFEIVLKKR